MNRKQAIVFSVIMILCVSFGYYYITRHDPLNIEGSSLTVENSLHVYCITFRDNQSRELLVNSYFEIGSAAFPYHERDYSADSTCILSHHYYSGKITFISDRYGAVEVDINMTDFDSLEEGYWFRGPRWKGIKYITVEVGPAIVISRIKMKMVEERITRIMPYQEAEKIAGDWSMIPSLSEPNVNLKILNETHDIVTYSEWNRVPYNVTSYLDGVEINRERIYSSPEDLVEDLDSYIVTSCWKKTPTVNESFPWECG